MASKKDQPKPWDNVAWQLGKGKKTVQKDPNKLPTGELESAGVLKDSSEGSLMAPGSYDPETGELYVDPELSTGDPLTEAVEAPGINEAEATPEQSSADQAEADKKPPRKAYVRKFPPKPTLDSTVGADLADDRGSDYERLMAKRAEYKLSGFYHWQCPVDLTCWKYRGNRAVCPECGAERKSLMAIYGQERVAAGHFEPYRGIQTWAQSANKQMAALASRMLREQSGGEPEAEQSLEADDKPSRYYVEYEDPTLYLKEMERVDGDEARVDLRNVKVTLNATNIAAARSKLNKVLADEPTVEAAIWERKDLQQNGGGRWKFQPFLVEN